MPLSPSTEGRSSHHPFISLTTRSPEKCTLWYLIRSDYTPVYNPVQWKGLILVLFCRFNWLAAVLNRTRVECEGLNCKYFMLWSSYPYLHLVHACLSHHCVHQREHVISLLCYNWVMSHTHTYRFTGITNNCHAWSKLRNTSLINIDNYIIIILLLSFEGVRSHKQFVVIVEHRPAVNNVFVFYLLIYVLYCAHVGTESLRTCCQMEMCLIPLFPGVPWRLLNTYCTAAAS